MIGGNVKSVSSLYTPANWLKKPMLSAAVLLTTAFAHTAQAAGNPATSGVGDSRAKPIMVKSLPRRPADLTPHAKDYYMATLGVDSLALKAVESGLMIRFTYRVVDPEKADPLRNKKINPVLIDELSHRALVIPTLEKVGELRQSGTAEAGKVYWMLFSNKGDFVKTGSRVSLVFGKSHIDGLVVQ